jgi:multiple sugar transport system permease protein
LPSLIGGSISVAVVWKAMFVDHGVVAQIGELFGGDGTGWEAFFRRGM